MAAANITVVGDVCTIESDTTGAVISNGTTSTTDFDPAWNGELRNHGPADVWLYITQDGRTAAATSDVVTTGAQAQKQIPLPAGATLKIRRNYRTIAHKTAAGTAVMSWMPY